MTTEEKKTQQEAALDDSALEGVTGGVSQFNQTLQEDMARAKQQISAIQEDMAKATQQLGTAQENLSGIRQQLGLAQENLSGLTQKFSAKNDKGV